jgi:hypothetical protein
MMCIQGCRKVQASGTALCDLVSSTALRTADGEGPGCKGQRDYNCTCACPFSQKQILTAKRTNNVPSVFRLEAEIIGTLFKAKVITFFLMEDKQMIEPGLIHCGLKVRLDNTESRKTSPTGSFSCLGYKN